MVENFCACEMCGKKVKKSNFEVAHRIPWSQGGRTTLDNAMIVCKDCFKKTEDYIPNGKEVN